MYYLEQWNKIIISDEQRSYLLAFVDKPEPQQMVISQNIAGHLQVRILALTGALEVVICVFLSVYLSLTIFISSSHLQNCSSFLQHRGKTIVRELLLDFRLKLDHNISMIQEVFSSGIERVDTKRVATSNPIFSFSPGVLPLRPVQSVHLLNEILYFSTLAPNPICLGTCFTSLCLLPARDHLAARYQSKYIPCIVIRNKNI